jgi:S-formylglutathione hydrolase FrmB
MKRHSLFFFLITLLFMSCQNNAEKTEVKNEAAVKDALPEVAQITIERDTNIVYDFEGESYEVMIKVPNQKPRGTILILQGWNFPNSSWCDSSSLCDKALEKGYVLVFPDMGKSIYQYNNTERTREDWQKQPTYFWLSTTVLLDLESEFGLFDFDHNNFVIGLSTGGRGAMFVGQRAPLSFKAAASLSGDFDQRAFPNDNLYLGFFGSDQSKWDSNDNPIAEIDEFLCPMYIGHGMKDQIVSFEHFEHLQQMAEKKAPNWEVQFHADSIGRHDYAYWNSEVDAILRFFETHRE